MEGNVKRPFPSPRLRREGGPFGYTQDKLWPGEGNSFQKPAGIINLMITRILIVAVLVSALAAPAYADQKKAESSSDGLDDLIGVLGGSGRKTSLDEGSSSHSIRGLSRASAGKGATKPEAANSVKSMESFSVSDDELKKFQKDGDLK